MPLKAITPTYKAPPRIAAQTQTHKYAIFPAPNRGLDSSRPLVAQDPLTGAQLNNWWIRKWGPELRGGYERWTTGLGGATRSLMAYRAPPGSTGLAESRLFAACNDFNIYDVTSQTAEAVVPVADQAVPGQVNPGVFSYVNISVAGINYLACVAAGGGYWTYDDAGGWVDRTLNITLDGAGLADEFDYVMLWMGRLWFIRNNTTEAYYLDVNSIQGNAHKFDFGALLSHGGQLAMLVAWTVDAGDGIGDKLVVIASEGDVVVYGGTDPSSSTTFVKEGTWFVGKTPSGRRFASDHGGDLSIITERGVEYMSHLQQGRGLLNPESVRDTPSYRYNEIIGKAVKDSRGQEFWTILYHPGEEAVIIGTPRAASQNSRQFIFSVLSTGWSTFTNMPMRCLEVFGGELYFGSDDGYVLKAFDANTDDQLSDGTVGGTIFGQVQTAYVTDSENPMSLKRPLLVQPMFQAPAPPSLTAQINTEWSTNGTAGSPSFSEDGGSLWDASLWDTAIWGNAEQAYFAWLGVAGLGCYMSLKMVVAGLPGTIFTSWKLIYEPGGVM